MTLKTKKREKNALLFSRYEKDRRSRFNALLDKLATLLPDYAESNNAGQKWTKAQIIDNAIKFIKSLQSTHAGDNNGDSSSNRVLKVLKKQNKKLREVLRHEFAPQMTEREFCLLDFTELSKLIEKKNEAAKENANPNAPNDAGDVFVVSTTDVTAAAASSSTDHTYSLIVQQEAEVEIGSPEVFNVEENANEVVVFGSQQPQAVIEEPGDNGAVQPPIIIQMATPVQTSFFQPTNVVPIQSVRCSMFPPPPNKLPLPRTYSSASTPATNVVNYNNSGETNQPWRLPKGKRKRKRAKKTDSKESTDKPSLSNEAAKTSVPSTTTSTVTTVTATPPSISTPIDSDFVRVSASSSLPKTILATEETEVVDLTVESEGSSSSAKKSKTNNNAHPVLGTSHRHSRAKSSYSIAALCQMSVNIGGDPAAGAPDSIPAGVNSPGVISLNSTESPRATPTPQSPSLPSSSASKAANLQQQQQQPSAVVPAQNSGSKLALGKKVIHELKPIEQASNKGPTSPTKSYLTQFPVVVKGQQQQQGQMEASRPLHHHQKASPSNNSELMRGEHNGEEASKAAHVVTAADKPKPMVVSTEAAEAGTSSSSKVMNAYPLPPMRPPPPATTQNHRALQSEYYQYNVADFSKQSYVKQQMHFATPPKAAQRVPLNQQQQQIQQQQIQQQHVQNNIYDSSGQQQMLHHGGYNQSMDVPPAAAVVANDNFFSVNQLVSHHGKAGGHQFVQQTKPKLKRASSNASRYANQKQANAAPNVKGDKPKEALADSSKAGQKLGKNASLAASSSSSRASSRPVNNAKRSYTAESLLSTQVVAEAGSIIQGQQQNVASSSSLRSSYNSRNESKLLPSSSSASSRVSEFNWNMTGSDASSHFAPFPCSISPSPNLFSQDFGGFDFSTSMFGDMHAAAATAGGGSNATKQTSSSSSSSRKDHMHRSTFNIHQQGQQQQLHQQQQQQHQDFGQQPLDSSQQHQIFDANFFSMPGGTPPSGSVYAHHQDEAYVTFSAASAASGSSAAARCYTKPPSRHNNNVPSQQQQQQQQQQQLQISDVQHHQQQHRQMLPDHQQHGYSSQHQQVLLSSTNNPPLAGGTSYMNFNLSTLFPEINVGGGADKPRAPSLAPPLPSLATSASSSTEFRTSDLLPASIAIFGGHHSGTSAPHQMSFTSVPFSTSSFHSSSVNGSSSTGLNFNDS